VSYEHLSPPPLPVSSLDTAGLAPYHPARLWLGLLAMCGCCLLLLYIAHVESVWLDAAPWSYGMARVDKEAPPEGARPAHIRNVPVDSLPADTPLVAEIRKVYATAPEVTDDELRQSNEDFLKVLGVGLAESILVFPASDEELAPLLESGRLPQRGKPEVLRGDLARADSFTLDGVEFKVVGRLKPSVGGMAFAYFLPEDAGLVAAHFVDARDTKPGWYIPDARTLPDTFGSKIAAAKAEDTGDESVAPDPFADQPVAQVRTRLAYRYGGLLALILGAIGGYHLHAQLFRMLARQQWPILGTMFWEVASRPRLFLAMHVLLFGPFFFAMYCGGELPLNNIAITRFVADQFTTGGLAYIGEAYARGDILSATLATFKNNYVIQTLGLTFGVSIVPLALGIVKTLFSFVLVGFVMVPLWAGTAGGYAYHSITMVLELEAYILACFVVAAYTLRFYHGVLTVLSGRSPAWEGVQSTLLLYWGGIVTTGLMLVIAAAYEATTLILIGGR